MIELAEGQLSIFDLIDKQPVHERVPVDPVAEFKTGDLVKVRKAKSIDDYDYIEDFYYLDAYEGKKGEIVGFKISSAKNIHYQVMMAKGEMAWFYEDELVYV